MNIGTKSKLEIGSKGISEALRSQRASSKPAPAVRNTPDPYLGLQFWVDYDNVQVAGFMECSGLTVETTVEEYAEGGLNTYTHKLPGRVKYGNITLKRGLDPGQDLFRWYQETLDGKIKRRNVTISMYKQGRDAAVKQWKLKNAFPVKYTGPDMKAEAGALAIETLEFAHEGLVFDNAPVVDLPGSGGRKE